jgi:hypothetical protein
MTTAYVQPSHFMLRVLVRLPITFLSLVKSTTITTSGGANSPFRIADQNSIFTALKPAKSNANPSTCYAFKHKVSFYGMSLFVSAARTRKEVLFSSHIGTADLR